VDRQPANPFAHHELEETMHSTTVRLGPAGKRVDLPPCLSALAVGLMFLVGPSAQAGAKGFDSAMQPILASYLEIHDALASDGLEGVVAQARSIEEAAKSLDPSHLAGEHADHYKTVPQKLGEAAAAMGKASDLEQAREALKGLSKPMAMWATMSKPKGINVVFCAMAKGSWLQRGKEIRNPYYGASMPKCGEIVSGPDASK
jgi:Cu(I)/Ag(I) efflux system membrane fusion protein